MYFSFLKRDDRVILQLGYLINHTFLGIALDSWLSLSSRFSDFSFSFTVPLPTLFTRLCEEYTPK